MSVAKRPLHHRISGLAVSYNGKFMLRFILDLATAVRVFLTCRTDLALEILALRQQAAVLRRKRPRPKLRRMDRLFWTAVSRTSSG